MGICLSALCAVHCLALPLVLTVAPAFISAALIGHGFHLALLLPLTLIAVASIVPRYLRHRRLAVLMGALAGLSLICGGAFAEELLRTDLERILTVSGSLLLIASHAANLALHRRLAG
jgi:hypothetical protein